MIKKIIIFLLLIIVLDGAQNKDYDQSLVTSVTFIFSKLHGISILLLRIATLKNLLYHLSGYQSHDLKRNNEVSYKIVFYFEDPMPLNQLNHYIQQIFSKEVIKKYEDLKIQYSISYNR